MLIGLDFDNTIVCYDRLFYDLALARGLIEPEMPANKTSIRDHLRLIGREEEWTRLQGLAYGPEITQAETFPGVLDFLHECKRRGVPTAIVSHKTRHPYVGEPHDLHAAAREFLRTHGFFESSSTGIDEDNVFLELTKDDKLARIANLGCTHFVDDLPEFLSEPSFPNATRRFLFDPDDRYFDEPQWTRFGDWKDLAGKIDWPKRRATAAAPGRPTEAGVRRLLDYAKLPADGVRLEPIAGGGNNRGFCLTTADGADYFLKWYFRHRDDPRDRLGTEFGFTEFCWLHGVEDVPKPLVRDRRAGLALYEFVRGRRLMPAEVDAAAVDAALAFLRRLNEHRGGAAAAKLPQASEACFSVQDHVERIGRRVQQLVETAAPASSDETFRAFVHDDLAAAWSEVYRRIDEEYPIEVARRIEPLPDEDRRLSPSDFGFHNALLQPDGRLRFIDLEYAGWDAPSKLICDFFCQVQVPVPRAHRARFVEGVTADLSWRDEIVRRVRCLMPAYRVKWACIVLNEFLPAGSARRSFGTAQPPSAERRAAQLNKARELLGRLSEDFTL